MQETVDVSVKGKRKKVNAYVIDGVSVIERGRLFRVAEIFDEYWLEQEKLPCPEGVIAQLSRRDHKPDLFTFAQKVPEVDRKYSYFTEWGNVAVIPISSYEQWFQKQISSATKRNIRASEKKGVEVRVSDYNDDYVRGIMAIYNESPTRHGKQYWHFGKDFDTVKLENGTYSDRSIYLGAYHQNEMIGYLKIVVDKNTAAIMQILSKMKYLELKPNNALLSAAVKQCCFGGIKYLCYERLIYGKKVDDSLTKFKQNNGFIKMDIPRYYIPLTRKGAIALKCGVHKKIKENLPEWLLKPLRDLRDGWYKGKTIRGY